MPGRTHVATLVRTWDSQMDEQSAGQPCTHMSLNKGDPNPAPTQIELALFHCSCCVVSCCCCCVVLCFCSASATDCLLSTGSDKSVLALLCVIYFWPSCYLLLLSSSSSSSSLCVQRFLSSTACQHKMDMYQLIYTARGEGRGGQPWSTVGANSCCAPYPPHSYAYPYPYPYQNSMCLPQRTLPGAICLMALRVPWYRPLPLLSTGTRSHCAMTAIKGHEHKLPNKSVERGADSIPNATSATKIIAEVKGRKSKR